MCPSSPFVLARARPGSGGQVRRRCAPPAPAPSGARRCRSRALGAPARHPAGEEAAELADADGGGELGRASRPSSSSRPTSTISWSRSATQASFVPKPAWSIVIADGAGDVGVVELEVRAHVHDQRAVGALLLHLARGRAARPRRPAVIERAAVQLDDGLEVRRLRPQRPRATASTNSSSSSSRSISLWRRSKPIVEETFMIHPGPAAERAAEVPGPDLGLGRAATGAGSCRLWKMSRAPSSFSTARSGRATSPTNSVSPVSTAQGSSPRGPCRSGRRRCARGGGPGVCRARTRTRAELELPAVVEGLVVVLRLRVAVDVDRRRPVAAASRPWPDTWSAWLWVSSTWSMCTPR